MHYHVVENTPGYLPESEPACFRNRQDADRYAREVARDLREQDYTVTGNPADGFYAERGKNDLGRVAEVIATDEDCDIRDQAFYA